VALTVVDGGMLSATNAQYTMYKNRLINGEMDISQRGTSFSTPANSSYTLDRWFIGWTGAAVATVAQVAGPTGFRNALRITGAASNTLTFIVQRIESLNCSDLSGQTVTLQANIAVSSAQTVYWQLAHPNTQDNYAASTVFASGTWSATTTATTFTAVITNLPAGATNGLQLLISPNNVGAFTSGTITITGVQLERGSNATSFDVRPYGTELSLCQRYFQLGDFSNILVAGQPGIGASTQSYAGYSKLPVVMRATPSSTSTAGGNNSNLNWVEGGSSRVATCFPSTGSVIIGAQNGSAAASGVCYVLAINTGAGFNAPFYLSAEL
jgi:hypothetical protein